MSVLSNASGLLSRGFGPLFLGCLGSAPSYRQFPVIPWGASVPWRVEPIFCQYSQPPGPRVGMHMFENGGNTSRNRPLVVAFITTFSPPSVVPFPSRSNPLHVWEWGILVSKKRKRKGEGGWKKNSLSLASVVFIRRSLLVYSPPCTC